MIRQAHQAHERAHEQQRDAAHCAARLRAMRDTLGRRLKAVEDENVDGHCWPGAFRNPARWSAASKPGARLSSLSNASRELDCPGRSRRNLRPETPDKPRR